MWCGIAATSQAFRCNISVVGITTLDDLTLAHYLSQINEISLKCTVFTRVQTIKTYGPFEQYFGTCDNLACTVTLAVCHIS